MAETDHYFSAEPGSAFTPREIVVRLAGADRRLVTGPGIFSPERVDRGTQVLLANVPAPPAEGELLDVGCGWGPIALTMALESPAARVWAVDVNQRALDLLRRNAERLGLENVVTSSPDDVPTDLRFRAIWSNPPIRVGKDELHGILDSWMPRLDSDGEAWQVVAKSLGADSLQRWMQERFPDLETVRAANDKGFRVLRSRPRG